jgi:hypothetical protein
MVLVVVVTAAAAATTAAAAAAQWRRPRLFFRADFEAGLGVALGEAVAEAVAQINGVAALKAQPRVSADAAPLRAVHQVALEQVGVLGNGEAAPLAPVRLGEGCVDAQLRQLLRPNTVRA